VRGDAGMGKTTTLEHLFLADLQNALQNLAIIPFFFELKDYNGKDLLAQIAKQNKVDETALRKALHEGKLCLFLDGFDEILSDEKRNNLEIIIKDEILTTPSQVLISSRVREYEHDIFKMRVFDLQALSKEQIREFASKNIAEDKKAIFLQALFEKENSILLSICRNIFILKVYKNEIIEAENGEISSKNIGKLLQNLVNRRVDRQIKENKPNANTVKKDLGKYKKMINFLAYTLIDKELSFDYDLAVDLLENEYKNLSLADDCLNFYKSIGLIKGETEILKFTHKLYWEYFAAEFIWAKIQLQFDDIQRYIAVPKWKKVLNLVRGLAGETSTKIVETVAITDALTMAESIGSSIEQKPEEVIFVAMEAEKQARNFQNTEISARGFLALMELGEMDKVLEILKTINPNKTHKLVIENLIQQADTDKALDIMQLLLKLGRSRIQLKIWAMQSFDKDILNKNQSKKIEPLIQMLIQNNKIPSLKIAESWIGKYQLIDVFSIEDLIIKLIKKTHRESVFIAEKWIKKHLLKDNFSIENLIIKLIQINNFETLQRAENWIEKYQLKEKNVIQKLIKALILFIDANIPKQHTLWEYNSAYFIYQPLIANFKLAEDWIIKYQMQTDFPMEYLIRKLIQINDAETLQLAENWIEKYQLKEKSIIQKLIKALILFIDVNIPKQQHINLEYNIAYWGYQPLIANFELVENWIKKYQMQKYFPIKQLIRKLIQINHFETLYLAKNWVEIYKQQDYFKIVLINDK